MRRSEFLVDRVRRGEWLSPYRLGSKLEAEGHGGILMDHTLDCSDAIERAAREATVFFVRHPAAHLDGEERRKEFERSMGSVYGDDEQLGLMYDSVWIETVVGKNHRVATVAMQYDGEIVVTNVEQRPELPSMALGPTGVVVVPLTQGVFRKSYTAKCVRVLDRPTPLQDDTVEEEFHGQLASWHFLCYTCALLGCANVSIEEREAEGRSRIVRNKDGIKEREPRLKYKTLVVRDSKRRVVADFGAGLNPNAPLHAVRGHFKTYTEERPLLGRHVGRYWFPAHVRGSAENGAIAKDYDIRTSQVPPAVTGAVGMKYR